MSTGETPEFPPRLAVVRVPMSASIATLTRKHHGYLVQRLTFGTLTSTQVNANPFAVLIG